MFCTCVVVTARPPLRAKTRNPIPHGRVEVYIVRAGRLDWLQPVPPPSSFERMHEA